jgi:hypothetical protein
VFIVDVAADFRKVTGGSPKRRLHLNREAAGN